MIKYGKIIIVLAVIAGIYKRILYVTDHSEDRTISTSNMTQDDFISFEYSQTASVSYECFGFSVTFKDNQRSIYGSFQDKKTGKYCDYTYENLSVKDYKKIRDIVNTLTVAPEKVKNPDDEELFVLDATETDIIVIRPDGTEYNLRIPDSDTKQQLYDLLVNISKKGKK